MKDDSKKKDDKKEVKKAKEETFTKNHSDDINKAHGEKIKNNVEDGEDTFGV